MRIKVAAQIEDHFLFKGIVEPKAKRVHSVLKEESQRCQPNQWHQAFRMVFAHHFVDDALRYRGKNDDRQRARDGTSQGCQREPGIAFQINKNAPDGLHSIQAQ